jgi:hypothetical protein
VVPFVSTTDRRRMDQSDQHPSCIKCSCYGRMYSDRTLCFPGVAPTVGNEIESFMEHTSHRAYLALGMIFVAISGHASAAVPINVPLTSTNWTTKGDVKFQKIEGFPNGLMENKGGAVLNGLVFKNGAIDVDVMFGKGISTIIFRRDDETGEALVLRPQPNCPASNDCIQYTPVMHGAFLWDLYPRYQTKAPLSDKEWNHIRIVVAGKRMKVFMNGLSQPVLYVDRMAGMLAPTEI